MYRVHLVTPCSGGYGVACSPDSWVHCTYAVDLCPKGIVEFTITVIGNIDYIIGETSSPSSGQLIFPTFSNPTGLINFVTQTTTTTLFPRC